MLIVYKMNLWFCKNMINIYSLQNACYLQNALPNITLTVQNSTLQSFCRQLKFSHSVGEIVRGIIFPIFSDQHTVTVGIWIPSSASALQVTIHYNFDGS